MSDGYPVKAGQYLHTDTVSPLATTEGKLHVKAPDLESVIADLATDSRLELVRSLLASLDGKTATEETAEQVKSVLDAISDKVASETTLTQAVEKLNDLLDRLDQKLTIDGEVQLKGSVAQVLDHERAAGFGVRVYYGQSVSGRLESAGAVPIVGKTVTIWFHNLSDYSTRNGVRLHWFLGGTVHDGIPVMDFGNVPAGSVLGIRIGGSAPDNAQIIHVPRFGGDGVVFSVDFHSSATGKVRTVIMEESSYA